jgi:hypothetical protein
MIERGVTVGKHVEMINAWMDRIYAQSSLLCEYELAAATAPALEPAPTGRGGTAMRHVSFIAFDHKEKPRGAELFLVMM